ncbi:DinB family protein [Fodinibius halophilus]|uniref:DinB family protein n=1 Tax=Fodinibius halophilus TaxID=1736908 RepID=A0A6M1T360_9BACT|nr:DinB family protein [Fodinibius halophilus]NGP87053.1 DinB family protein [Fodinibius halophilus]
MAIKKSVRTLLLEQLEGENAHVTFSQAVLGITYKQAGIKVEGVPHTIWELIEHIRIAQNDILEFCKNPEYEAIDWPEAYWPDSHSPNSKDELQNAIREVREGIEEMKSLVRDSDHELQELITHGDGQTLFREAMLIVDHNAYHIGQIVLVRKLLGSW